MTALVCIGVPLVVALVFGAGVLLGRRLDTQRAVDRLQRKEMYQAPVNPQALQDREDPQ